MKMTDEILRQMWMECLPQYMKANTIGSCHSLPDSIPVKVHWTDKLAEALPDGWEAPSHAYPLGGIDAALMWKLNSQGKEVRRQLRIDLITAFINGGDMRHVLELFVEVHQLENPE